MIEARLVVFNKITSQVYHLLLCTIQVDKPCRGRSRSITRYKASVVIRAKATTSTRRLSCPFVPYPVRKDEETMSELIIYTE